MLISDRLVIVTTKQTLRPKKMINNKMIAREALKIAIRFGLEKPIVTATIADKENDLIVKIDDKYCSFQNPPKDWRNKPLKEFSERYLLPIVLAICHQIQKPDLYKAGTKINISRPSITF